MRNYSKGHVSTQAVKILKRRSTPTPYTCVAWAPVHKGLEGKEAAHTAARDHAYQDIPSHSPNGRAALVEAEPEPVTVHNRARQTRSVLKPRLYPTLHNISAQFAAHRIRWPT